MSDFEKIKGSNYFRYKIAYSLLLNKPVEIYDIRSNDINPGLSESEISFLKLIEKITNGSKIEISKTGTILRFTPGVITNNYGDDFEFDCHNSRCITYYLEGILPISLFGKESLNCTLNGITNNDIDMSVDSFSNTTCKLIQKLVIGDTIKLDIKKRGVLPNGKGQVKFKCPIIIFLNYFDWVDEGKIKRIRGTAFTSKVSGVFATRMIDACRGAFNNFLPDVWILADNYKNKNKDEISPAYGISIVGETTNDFYLCHDIINPSNNKTNIFQNNDEGEYEDENMDSADSEIKTPEDLSRKCALSFLEELFYCGAVDTHNQGLILFLMALSTNGAISKLKIGRVSNYTIGLLRLIKNLFGIKFKITELEKDDYDEEIEEDDNMNECIDNFDDDDFSEKMYDEEIDPEKSKFDMPK